MQNTPNGRSKNKKCFKRSVVFLVQRLGKEILKSRITFKLRKSAKHPPHPSWLPFGWNQLMVRLLLLSCFPQGPWATSRNARPPMGLQRQTFIRASHQQWLEPVHSMRIGNHKYSVLYVSTRRRSMERTQYALNLIIAPCDNKFLHLNL